MACSDITDDNVEFDSVDTAVLRIFRKSSDLKLALYTQTEECYSCPLLKFCDLKNEAQQLFVNTSFKTMLAIGLANAEDDGKSVCKKEEWFGERGFYNLTLSRQNEEFTCSIDVEKEPVNSFYPILAAFFVYVGLILLYLLIRFIRRKFYAADVESEPLESAIDKDLGSSSASLKPKRKRLRSLDTFRGLSIVIMIFVNYGGGNYWFFNHSAWNGLTVADLVFPWFMFIMGTSMSLAFEGMANRNVPLRSKVIMTIRRSVILFLLGVFLNSGGDPNLKTLRIFGVLQRFGVAYFVIGLIKCFRHVKKDEYKLKWERLNPLKDVLSCWVEWLVGLAFVFVWLMITFLLPVAGCPKGYLGPGGVSDDGKYYNCTGGAAGYVDRTILTTSHMYQTPTCKIVYNTVVPYDPEGILGCLTATFIVLLGLQVKCSWKIKNKFFWRIKMFFVVFLAGQTVLFFPEWRDRVKRWAFWALLTGGIAAALCKCSQNDGWIPINKNLWSLSFVLLMASFAYVSLIVFLIVIDVKNFWNGAPLYQCGMNSITLYCGHEILGSYLPFSWVAFTQTHWEYLAMNLWGASLWVVIAFVLDQKKLYFSV